MVMAFVLIDIDQGSEQGVIEDLKKIDGVEEALGLHGNHGIIAKVKADTIGRLKEIVTYGVKRISKVKSTLTLLTVEDPRILI